MASILVLYGTGEGQTATVAERIVDALSDRGHAATAVDARAGSPDRPVAAYDAVIVGASVHAGKHQSAVSEFVTANRDALSGKPTAFFQVSLSSATESGRAQAAGYVDAFLEDTGWHPDRIAYFGGALRYSKFGFVERFVVKQVVKRSMPDLAASGDVEFTDWDAVDAFAADIAAFVEGRLGVVPPAAIEPGSDE